MSYNSRQTPPSKDNKYYYSKINPFYPSYVDNCTWYANGRTQENGFSTKGIPVSNAENWYKDATVEKGKSPRLGALIVWRCGEYHKAKDGAGHVGVVEKIYNDGSILVSHSGTNMKFKTNKLDNSYKYPFTSKYKYTFEGFVYPIGCTGGSPEPTPKKEEYYTIVKGDTLTKIAKKYKTTVKELLKLNPQIKDKNKIYAGQKVRVK